MRWRTIDQGYVGDVRVSTISDPGKHAGSSRLVKSGGAKGLQPIFDNIDAQRGVRAPLMGDDGHAGNGVPMRVGDSSGGNSMNSSGSMISSVAANLTVFLEGPE